MSCFEEQQRQLAEIGKKLEELALVDSPKIGLIEKKIRGAFDILLKATDRMASQLGEEFRDALNCALAEKQRGVLEEIRRQWPGGFHEGNKTANTSRLLTYLSEHEGEYMDFATVAQGLNISDRCLRATVGNLRLSLKSHTSFTIRWKPKERGEDGAQASIGLFRE